MILPVAHEPLWKRRFYSVLALAFLCAFFTYHHSFWAPAHPGVDQNGYLVGGKQLARTGTTELRPINAVTKETDPFKFIGLMWVGADYNTPKERYYPKYPVGLPLMVAAALKIAGPSYGPVLTYFISPVSMTLAVAAVFLLVRRVAGSFLGLVGMIAFALSPGIRAFVNNPNSHAPTLVCVTMGMYLLLRWWHENERYARQVKDEEELSPQLILWGDARPVPGRERPLLSAVTASAAGLLLGFAGTIRYTELTLLLPLLAALLFNLRLRSARSWIESGLLLTWWAIPVIFLFAFNLKTLGSWTGYDPTHESDKAFQWEYFRQNWEPMMRQIAGMGLYLIAPIGLAGLVCMFVFRTRLAVVLALWLLPNLAIYTFYYWAPDQDDMGYIRFFLTSFPVFVIAAFWLLSQIQNLPDRPLSPRQRKGFVVACGVAFVAPFVSFAHLAGVIEPANGKGIYTASHLLIYPFTHFTYQTLHLGNLDKSDWLGNHLGFLAIAVVVLIWLILFALLSLIAWRLEWGTMLGRAVVAVLLAGAVLAVALIEEQQIIAAVDWLGNYLGFILSVGVGVLLWLIPFTLLALIARRLDRGTILRRAHVAMVLTAGAVLAVALLEDQQIIAATEAHDHYLDAQLAETTRRIVDARRHIPNPNGGKGEDKLLIPPGSYVFCGGMFSPLARSLPNHLQFAGDFEIYASELFNYDVLHGVFFRGGRDRDPDRVQVIDASRSKANFERLKNYSRDDLLEQQRKIINNAINDGRAVFYIGKIDDGSYWSARQIPADVTSLLRGTVKKGPRPPADLTAELVDAWSPMLIAPRPERTTVQGRFGGGGLFWDRTSAWQIVEIKRAAAAPTTLPMDRATSRAVTKPATRTEE